MSRDGSWGSLRSAGFCNRPNVARTEMPQQLCFASLYSTTSASSSRRYINNNGIGLAKRLSEVYSDLPPFLFVLRAA